MGLPAPASGKHGFSSFCHNLYQIRETVRSLKNGPDSLRWKARKLFRRLFQSSKLRDEDPSLIEEMDWKERDGFRGIFRRSTYQIQEQT